MNRLKKYILSTLTINDLVEYFYNKGIGFDFKFEKKQQPLYYAHDSRLYRRDK